jgi:hypothetical protein
MHLFPAAESSSWLNTAALISSSAHPHLFSDFTSMGARPPLPGDCRLRPLELLIQGCIYSCELRAQGHV